ncbi:MAG: GH39 family glycosyl hydrolase [Chloroflexota bacterium]
MTTGSSARIAWFAEIGAQTERDRPAPDVTLPPPGNVSATPGRGQVTIDWDAVDGAAGYLVHRSATADGPWSVIDHRGGDVLAVPHGPYADTLLANGETAWYAVSSIPSIEAPAGELSVPVRADSREETAEVLPTVRIEVDAGAVVGPTHRPWRPVIGSEHLALLLRGEGPGGHNVGDELAESFRIVRAELGVRTVRAHGILHDSLGLYRERDGRAIVDYDRVDAAYDRLLETGLRPLVELSFMPRDLASDPDRSVFDYRGIISPPRSLDRWAELVGGLVRHLAGRYGRDEVGGWQWEVWNEPNLRVFWSGGEGEYFDLYDATARAVKEVDTAFPVGGPSTAAAGWIDDLLAHAADAAVPVDFLSTHTYGVPPLDLRPIAARFGRPEIPLLWTEWGISPTHGSPINDSAWGAPLVCRGMRSAAGRLESLAYWVASDHFVELDEPERLLHGGFGLLTVGNLRKPRYWALRVLELLGEEELEMSCEGDGGGSLVEAWATRDDRGRFAIAVWNGTIDQTKSGGDAALDRDVVVEMNGLPHGRYVLRHRRVDLTHSNVAATADELAVGAWPTAQQWDRLRERDVLEDLEPPIEIRVGDDGRGGTAFPLPMPGVSLVEIAPIA